MKHSILPLLATSLVLVFIFSPLEIVGALGQGDFKAYWSASYLLVRSDNFADPVQLLAVEQEQGGHSGDYSIMTWNPPWMLVLLAPLTTLPFRSAARLWLLFNICAVFTSAVLTWRLFTRRLSAGNPTIGQERMRYLAILAPLAVFAFQPTSLALIMGQINTLVLIGLVIFLFLNQRGNTFQAGMALSLVMVKPHLVYVTLPLIMLWALLVRRWRIIAGFCATLVLLMAIAYTLRPSFMGDYLQLVGREERLLLWHTPTLGGAIRELTGSGLGQYLGIVVLPLTVFIWYGRYRHVDPQVVVSVGTIISLTTAPFGWSYDQVLLVIPIVQLLAFVYSSRASRLTQYLTLLALVIVNSIAFYLRIHAESDVYFFWVVPVIGLIYWWAVQQERTPERAKLEEVDTAMPGRLAN